MIWVVSEVASKNQFAWSGVHSMCSVSVWCIEMNAKTKKQLKSIAELATCNPFSPRRFEIERDILGAQCEDLDAVAWHRNHEVDEADEGDRYNVVQLTRMAAEAVDAVLAKGQLSDELHREYWATATYLLLYRHITPLDRKVMLESKARRKVETAWDGFWNHYQRIFNVGNFVIDKPSAAHLFSCLMQIHRAFFNIFSNILGSSKTIATLREQVWDSIFTCCPYRYHDSMYDRMRDLSTLVTGPSGTGKELVAQAIGLSQYIPFDPESGQFEVESENLFLPLNLSALSPTLIESELFGHRKGSFTGAVIDRVGWLEACGPCGAVFLDEIGELGLELQVKLLRVLQARTYCRLGDTTELTFKGKIIAATNRNLEQEIANGNFREDFYFRICSDRIQTPSLREQLADQPSDLPWLIESILRRQVVEDQVGGLSSEITSWIESHLGTDYPWPGNIRELEQCVRSFLVRQNYVPIKIHGGERGQYGLPTWLQPVVGGNLTAEELLSRYCTFVYSQQGSYEKTAQIVKLDRRTVKAKIDEELLQSLKRTQ